MWIESAEWAALPGSSPSGLASGPVSDQSPLSLRRLMALNELESESDPGSDGLDTFETAASPLVVAGPALPLLVAAVVSGAGLVTFIPGFDCEGLMKKKKSKPK